MLQNRVLVPYNGSIGQRARRVYKLLPKNRRISTAPCRTIFPPANGPLAAIRLPPYLSAVTTTELSYPIHHNSPDKGPCPVHKARSRPMRIGVSLGWTVIALRAVLCGIRRISAAC